MLPETLPRAQRAPQAVRVGLDVGGSSVKAVASTLGDEPMVLSRLRHDRLGSRVVADLARMARAMAGDARLDSVGVTVPGIVEHGVVRASANIPQLVGLDLARELSAELSVPVTVMNDGTAAALAEARIGAGRGSDDVFVAVLGTGVAGSHVVDGAFAPGAHGQAGELGHLRVPESDATCSCGAIGCLETVIGAPALIAAWEAVRGPGQTLADLQAAARLGSREASSILEHAAHALASGILTLSALVDPARLVVGGGVSEAHPGLVSRAAELAGARATFHHLPEVVGAHFGAWSGAVGSLLA